jgi:hypothetical protein
MNTKNKPFFYLKIFFIFIFVYFVSSGLIKNIFLANSPQINPKLENYLLAKLKNNGSVPLAKGVSAYTKDGITYRKYELNKIEWQDITYYLKNGKKVTLKIPKGQSPLSQEEMEKMYQ